MTYLILFISAFASATLLPLGSEALLIYNIKEGFNIYALLLIATFGNVLGSILNYYLGLKGEEYLVNKNLVKEKCKLPNKMEADEIIKVMIQNIREAY